MDSSTWTSPASHPCCDRKEWNNRSALFLRSLFDVCLSWLCSCNDDVVSFEIVYVLVLI